MKLKNLGPEDKGYDKTVLEIFKEVGIKHMGNYTVNIEKVLQNCKVRTDIN